MDLRRLLCITALAVLPLGCISVGMLPLGKLRLVDERLAREPVPETILFLTDGVEPAAFDAFQHQTGKDQLMVLGIGTEQGGPVRTGPDSFLEDATGRRVFTRLDVEELRRLREADVAVATVTLDDSDVKWVVRHAQTHLAQREAKAAPLLGGCGLRPVEWRDPGERPRADATHARPAASPSSPAVRAEPDRYYVEQQEDVGPEWNLRFVLRRSFRRCPDTLHEARRAVPADLDSRFGCLQRSIGEESAMTNLRPAQLALVLVGGACAALVGCSTTQRVKVKNSGDCVFLRPIVCTRLQPAGGTQADMRYVNPEAQWQQYSKVMVMPITFWGSDKSKISASDRQALADYFYATLVKHLGEKFTVVDQPGPGVMKLQIAITDAEAATPVLRTVSMVVPQARALNTLKYLATGTYSFVGSAQGEVEVSDSVTGEVLAAAMDRQVGGGSLETAAQWQWGDAENAMDAWAEQATTRLSSWTSGTATP